MKELFIAYSKYNEKTNNMIFDYIRQMTYEQLSKQSNTHFKSIAHTVYHLLKSDLKWLSRMSEFIKSELTVDKPDIYQIFEKIESFCKLRMQVNTEMKQLISAIPEHAFREDFTMPFGKNSITKPLWQLLFQWFNHHTHHRGQISNQLDLVGVENNYSMLLDKI